MFQCKECKAVLLSLLKSSGSRVLQPVLNRAQFGPSLIDLATTYCTTTSSPTVARTRTIAREYRKKVVQDWWGANAPAQYQRSGLGSYPDNNKLTRSQMATLVALRTGHGNFSSY
ncbi:hypothetical protein QBC47DRAFT_362509 [Echria macrotheca]|uniref:Uncharacterized protein n=1 Tax=Echria macrotheca TaxID=438768 RepID=A0AAJ0F9Y1_9PEZI|nr:hypothetical protein QBC47DRAFT_362509 [Echria macrotheca]